MLVSFLLIILGLGILLGGAEYLVKGAGSLSKKAGIPPLVIGLTVVAFGTSAPELIVNVYSALQGTTSLALGNILGSNIANILFILGVAGLFAELRVNHSTTRKEIPFSLLAVLALWIMANDILLDGGAGNMLTRTDGLILLGFFSIFMYYTVDLAKKDKPIDEDGEEEIETFPTRKSLLFTIGGCVGLFLGGKLLVDNAVNIATVMGVSERIIGLTIVAIGTSLPELATSVVAVRKGHTDIAIGNVVGSNIFNIFWILGITSVITPIQILPEAQTDILLAVLATLLLFFTMFIDKKHHIQKRQAAIMLIMYISYMGYLIFM